MKQTNYFWEPLKLDHTNVWFWSDLHLGHRCDRWEIPLWKNRGFDSVEEHDDCLRTRWNNNVKNNSIVFHLGDIMFGGSGEQRLINTFENLNFKELYLMGGNHHAGYKQLFEKSINDNGVHYSQFEEKKVYFVPNYFEIMVCGQPVVLSHYAIVSWNGQGKGSWMIHGHSHGSLYKSELGKLLYQAKILDVGVENCNNPISFSEIRSKFKKTNLTFDHHDQYTLNPF